ncbi:MAG: hypothetical protein HY556_12080 [Euryarchaeota archaeon]|nr:hypothetical protein [Euryarchaeota archaeon]
MLRFRIVIIALLALAGQLATVAAHVDGLDHAIPDSGRLAPGEGDVHELRFSEGPLQAGWVFIVNFYQTIGTEPLQVFLELDNRTQSQWSVRPGEPNHLMRLIPETGNYTLRVSNPSSSDNASYVFFYDQSCNCIGKLLPPANETGVPLDHAIVIFNVDVEPGYKVFFNLTEPPAQKVTLAAATLRNDTAQWPIDYDVIATSAPSVAFHRLSFDAHESGRYYIFVESVEARIDRFTSVESALIYPSITVESLDAEVALAPGQTPLDSILAIVLSPLGLLIVVALYLASYPLVFRKGKKKQD